MAQEPSGGSISLTPFRALVVAALFGGLAGWLIVVIANANTVAPANTANCHPGADADRPELTNAAATFANTAMLLHPRYRPKVTVANTASHRGHAMSCDRRTSSRMMCINADTITAKVYDGDVKTLYDVQVVAAEKK